MGNNCRSSSKFGSSLELILTLLLLVLYLLSPSVVVASSASLPHISGLSSGEIQFHNGAKMGISSNNGESSSSSRIIAEEPSYISSGPSGGGGGGDVAGNNNYNGGYGGYGGESSLMILAPRRTHRKDPLNGLSYYNGGWNISDRHYWASVGFSAAPLFITALAWFLVFAICWLILTICHFCCRREQHIGYSGVAYVFSLILLILFTLAAVIGCFVLYTGQVRFHRSTVSTLDYLRTQADTTVWKLNNVSGYLSSAKQIGVQNVFLPSNVQTEIDEVEMKITAASTFLDHQSTETANDVRDVLDSVIFDVWNASARLHFSGSYKLVLFGGILVMGTFILCGIFLLFHNVTTDTCMAMHQWSENPTAHTALDELLPCVDPATSEETLKRSKEVTSQLVDLVNSVISNVSNINFGPQFRPFYFNQSGPLLPFLCNPFSPDVSDRQCSRGEFDLNNGTQVLGNYVCQVDPNGICITTGRLTPSMYDEMVAAVNVSYGLYNYGSDLIALEDCSFVRESFTSIYRDHCPGLRRYSRWVYVGLVMVSVAVMFPSFSG